MKVEVTVTGGDVDVSMVKASTVVSENGGIFTVDMSNPVITVNFSTIEIIVNIEVGATIVVPDLIEWTLGDNMEWSAGDYVEWS